MHDSATLHLTTLHLSRRRAPQVFLRDVLHGLSRPQKRLPCKYFYDEEGSRLFDRICELDEYYVTRTETAIMRKASGQIASLVGPDALIVELGSGSSEKTRDLLNNLQQPAGYVPIDISTEHLHRSAARIAADYPGLEVLPVCGDFMKRLRLPRPERTPARRVVYYPGSTIGNLPPARARTFLARIARWTGAGGGLLIGVDLCKDAETLERAYSDRRGVTAAFNLNLLARINRELGANFNLTAFRHLALYNVRLRRVEMHLVCTRAQTVTIADRHFEFRAGETIHTENSYKYTLSSFRGLARAAGWTPAAVFTDSARRFAVHWLTAA